MTDNTISSLHPPNINPLLPYQAGPISSRSYPVHLHAFIYILSSRILPTVTMQYLLLLLTSLAALGSSATIQKRGEAPWRAPVRAYFEAVGQELRAIQASDERPVCDFSSAQLPVTDSSPLPPPSEGLSVYHVAVGRGTQVRRGPEPNSTNYSAC